MLTIFKDLDDQGASLKFGSSILHYRDVSQIEAGLAAKECIDALKLKGRIYPSTAFNPS